MSKPKPKPIESLPEPTPEGRAEKALRKELMRKTAPPISAWFARRGVWLLLGLIAIVAAGSIVLGWSDAFDLLAGITSPSEFDKDMFSVGAAWVLALVGWLLIPALVGGVTGYVVSSQISQQRSLTANDVRRIADSNDEGRL